MERANEVALATERGLEHGGGLLGKNPQGFVHGKQSWLGGRGSAEEAEAQGDGPGAWWILNLSFWLLLLAA